jgi:AcrR family transcriptional regulator
MAPKNKFTKAEMVAAALQVVRAKGLNGLTAKTMAEELGTSTQPVFTCFGSMDGVKREVYAAAVRVYDRYTDAGLHQENPFFGVGMQYIRFAQEEPELYRILFLTRPQGQGCSAMESMAHLQALVRPTLMEVYRITPEEADRYFRDLWLVAHSLATLIVTGDCTYTDQEIGQILTGFSLSICRSIKEIPGFAAGTFDRDAAFRALVGKGAEEKSSDK